MNAVKSVVLSVAVLLASCTTTDNMRKVDLNKAAEKNAIMAYTYFEAGNLKLAKQKIEKAIKQDKRNALANSVYGLVQQRLGNADAADEYLSRAANLDPDEPEYAHSYATFLCDEGRVDESLVQFHKVAKNPLHRTPEAVYENAAVCAIKADRFGDAEIFVKRALAVKPNYATSRFILAELQFRSQRFREALESVQRMEGDNQMSAEVAAMGVRSARALNRPDLAEHFVFLLQTSYPNTYQARALAN